MTSRQHTIGKEADYQGIGLHTGNMCKAVFKPAPENHGVTLVRTDLPGNPSVQALYSNVLGVIRGTTVGNDDEAFGGEGGDSGEGDEFRGNDPPDWAARCCG